MWSEGVQSPHPTFLLLLSAGCVGCTLQRRKREIGEAARASEVGGNAGRVSMQDAVDMFRDASAQFATSLADIAYFTAFAFNKVDDAFISTT